MPQTAPPITHAPARPLVPAPLLHTARLQLRNFYACDADDVMALHAVPRLREHLLDDLPLDRPDSAALFLERIQHVYREHPGLGIWHASVPQPGGARFAGWFSLMPLAEHPGEIELGSRLLTHHWGQGVSMDGGEALLEHAFARLGRPRVWAACHPANRGARLCLQALGFTAGTPGSYADQPALLHSVARASWLAQAGVPRRQRLRAASATLHDEAGTASASAPRRASAGTAPEDATPQPALETAWKSPL